MKLSGRPPQGQAKSHLPLFFFRLCLPCAECAVFFFRLKAAMAAMDGGGALDLAELRGNLQMAAALLDAVYADETKSEGSHSQNGRTAHWKALTQQ